MSRSGEDVYEASTHKKHVIPMVYIKKEADWKAWRSGLAVAAKTVGLPHVLMSMAVDRDKVEQLKKTVSKLKKKKKKPTQAKKVVKAPATPARQVVKPEEAKVEVPEPEYEEIALRKKRLKSRGRRSWPSIELSFNTIKGSTTLQSKTGSSSETRLGLTLKTTVMLRSLTDSASDM